MHIPIENIYYLLCYAWDKLDESERINISVQDQTTLLDLFAKIMINGSKILLKRGIDRSYISQVEDIAGVKGKIQFGETIKKNLLFKQRTICEFDEFSGNILLNQVIVSTISRLIRTKDLDKEMRYELRSLYFMFGGVEEIPLRKSCFKAISLNRNNSFYGLLVNVCEIIYDSTLPTEESGKYKFSDFTRDDNKMNQLFESFIRNFYRREQSRFSRVRGEHIEWNFICNDRKSTRYLPLMKTDITLENEKEKIIIDAKYYRETMSVNYEKEKIKSNNLYQVFSYLLNQRTADPRTINAAGILLYPTIEQDYDLQYRYDSHNIYIKTVNLNTDWRTIDLRLKSIIDI